MRAYLQSLRDKQQSPKSMPSKEDLYSLHHLLSTESQLPGFDLIYGRDGIEGEKLALALMATRGKSERLGVILSSDSDVIPLIGSCEALSSTEVIHEFSIKSDEKQSDLLGRSLQHLSFKSTTVDDFMCSTDTRHWSGAQLVVLAALVPNDFYTFSKPGSLTLSKLTRVKGIGMSTGIKIVNSIDCDWKKLRMTKSEDRTKVLNLLFSSQCDFRKRFNVHFGDDADSSVDEYKQYLSDVIELFQLDPENDCVDCVDVFASMTPSDAITTIASSPTLQSLQKRMMMPLTTQMISKLHEAFLLLRKSGSSDNNHHNDDDDHDDNNQNDDDDDDVSGTQPPDLKPPDLEPPEV
jgi:hypothetical protein